MGQSASILVEGKQKPLTRYLVMQPIKESSSLRIRKKKRKPVPRTVFKFGKQSNEIKNYLRFRRITREQFQIHQNREYRYWKRRIWKAQNSAKRMTTF
jgi:hypothetical protein